MANFQKFLSSFDSSNLKGKQFEKFCKWFLENESYWKSKFTKVYLWDDYPKRWGADLGIDLIAESDDGSLCAIQAKCYSPEYPVTKKDMDSFLSESNRKEISTRLLLASTDIIGGNARKVCQSQEKPVTFFLYSDFLNSNIEFPEDINKLTKPKSKSKPKPRPHQADAIKNVLKGFKKHDRGQLIMACGTGKTFTTLWIKEKLNAETTLILLPSLNLLSQTLKEWYFGASKPFKSFAVCSDDSVTKSTEEDAVKESTQELSFPVSADTKQIQNFLKQKGPKVIFSTYQSSPMIADAMKLKSVPSFDLVICDEAHRCTGKVGNTFTTVLDDKKIRTKQKLFTTATPRTYSQSVKTVAKINEIEIAGMDDEAIFGPVFHKLSFGQAIANKPPLLTDYQVVIVGVDSPTIKELIDERKILEINPDDNIDAESLAAQIGLLKAIKDYNLKRIITFHGRVSRAQNFSRDLLDVKDLCSKKNLPKGVIKTDFVSGAMPTSKRFKLLQQLNDLTDCDYYLLSNARCLSEGVDVPSIDGIGVIDPKKSKTDIVQTIGRAIRLSENKNIGTIVIPVFIEDGEDAETRIMKSNFQPVYDVLNALRAHDENLGFELDEIRTELGKKRVSTGPSKKIPKVIIDIPTKFNANFANALKTIIVNNTTSTWNYNFGLYLNYIDEYKTQAINVRHKNKDGFLLGGWVNDQRKFYKRGILSEDKIQKLESINFVWSELDYQWMKNYDSLKEYKRNHGHTLVPQKFETNDGIKLGNWVQTQRRPETKLTSDRKELLDDLGFIWDVIDAQWQSNLIELKNYLKEHKWDELKDGFKTNSGFSLASWVGKMKREIKLGTVSKEKTKILMDLGIDLEDRYETQWENGFEALRKFYIENGTTLVPPKYITKDGLNLSSWVQSQRDSRIKLSKDRKNKLESLNFIFDPFEHKWNEVCIRMESHFKNSKGLISQIYKADDGFALGQWFFKNKRLFMTGKLTHDKQEMFKKLITLYKRGK